MIPVTSEILSETDKSVFSKLHIYSCAGINFIPNLWKLSRNYEFVDRYNISIHMY